MNHNLVLIFDLDDTLYRRFGVVDDDNSGIENIKLLPGVKDFLENTKHDLILVTKGISGVPEIQNKKIDLLGIRKYFKEIMICFSDESKRDCFEEISHKFPLQSLIVIGDRINSEIRFGNSLNLTTILIRSGKYKDLKAENDLEIPNYEIKQFTELFGVLNKICKQ
jgi:FMN phosphatase YigB (HAD superfamily)